MWPQLGAPLGFLLANGLFLTLTEVIGDNTQSGWNQALLGGHGESPSSSAR